MFCPYCATEIPDDAEFCTSCGHAISVRAMNGNAFPKVEYQQAPAKSARHDDTMETLVKVFLVLGCVSIGWTLIPLAWCIPITLKVFNAFRDGTPISTALKVCALIFVSPVAGVILLVMDDV